MIHCIGDSHSSIFSGTEVMQPVWPIRSSDRLNNFKSYRIGPATAYQLENKIPILNQIVKLINKENDNLLFCFGEVDIRAHLKKQIDLQKKSIKEIVKECVDRYFKTILHYKSLGVNVMVWGPIASWDTPKPYSGPSFGTCLERNKITKEFNEYIKTLCEIESIPFFTIYYDMLLPNGKTNTNYLDKTGIHLNDNSLELINNVFKNFVGFE